jgi:uncharacterized membrane protein
VDAAEELTGLQFTVYVGPVGEESSRAGAEQLFVAAGLDTRPAVLVLVAPAQHRVEVVTAPSVRDRLPDAACEAAVATMVERFRAGSIEDGIVAGVSQLAAAAGPGAPAPGTTELPDVLYGEDERGG